MAIVIRLRGPAGRIDGWCVRAALHRCRIAFVRPDLRSPPAGPGLVRQGSRELVRRPGLAMRDVVFGRVCSRECGYAPNQPSDRQRRTHGPRYRKIELIEIATD